MKHLISAMRKSRMRRKDSFAPPNESRWNTDERNAVIVFWATVLSILMVAGVTLILYISN